MASAAKFIRGLEGNMRLRVNNKTIPDYAKGFKNPVPRPPNGGSGYIIPLAKFIAKGFKYAPLMLLYDLVFPKAVSDGTLPSWIKDVGEQQILKAGTVPFTGGQSPRIGYSIKVKVKRYFINNNQFIQEITYDRSGIGQIRDVFLKAAFSPQGYNQTFLVIIDTAPDGSARRFEEFTDGNNIRADLQSITITRTDGQPDTGGNLPSTGEIATNLDNQFAAGRALIETLSATDWKFDGFTELPTIKPGKITKLPDFFKLPEITKKPAVIPTEIPQPIPEPEFDIFPDPEPVFVPTPRPRIIPEPIISPDPQPDLNPVPDTTPKPVKKWTKITKYINQKTEIKTPIILDKTPKPLPVPEPIKPPPPIQTSVDKCADHCGGGTIDFNLPDDSELAELLKAIKKKVDEIEESVNQTLAGSIEVGSCKMPEDQTNETDEIVYVPDPAQQITYAEKGLKAIHTALQGIETKLTGMHEGICVTNDPPSAIPEWWQVRAGSDRPQLVVIYKGGNSYWSMAIPWYKGSYKSKIINQVPSFTRGSYATILTLSDNSKVVANASSKAEGEKVMTQIKALITGSLLKNAELKSGGERKGKQIKSIKVQPVYAKYFAHGQQDNLPDWRYNFKTQKFTKYDRADTR